MTQASVKSRSPVAAHPVTSAVITILTVAVVFFAVYVPIYARVTPKVGDFPFFYFYLLIYMPVVAIVCGVIIVLQRRLRPADGPAAADAGEVTR